MGACAVAHMCVIAAEKIMEVFTYIYIYEVRRSQDTVNNTVWFGTCAPTLFGMGVVLHSLRTMLTKVQLFASCITRKDRTLEIKCGYEEVPRYHFKWGRHIHFQQSSPKSSCSSHLAVPRISEPWKSSVDTIKYWADRRSASI